MTSKDCECEIVQKLGVPLCECRLTIELVCSLLQTMTWRNTGRHLAPELAEIRRLLTDCEQRLEVMNLRLKEII